MLLTPVPFLPCGNLTDPVTRESNDLADAVEDGAGARADAVVLVLQAVEHARHERDVVERSVLPAPRRPAEGHVDRLVRRQPRLRHQPALR